MEYGTAIEFAPEHKNKTIFFSSECFFSFHRIRTVWYKIPLKITHTSMKRSPHYSQCCHFIILGKKNIIRICSLVDITHKLQKDVLFFFFFSLTNTSVRVNKAVVSPCGTGLLLTCFHESLFFVLQFKGLKYHTN